MAGTLLLSIVEPLALAQNSERLILSQSVWGSIQHVAEYERSMQWSRESLLSAPGKRKQGNERYAPHLHALLAHSEEAAYWTCRASHVSSLS